ncbi:NAD-dependent epimerase/dehydratase family protein [Actinocorallia sp. B10E7]|uniref:NAD-dependent epimerase/dehydratase family protein n=1 Tax=Actinocorallia sp. B10E7 TaxID=3153558 RepID=UPI00325E1D5A
MNIFLTGATGYIGSGVLSALVQAGHSVTALVRDEKKAEAVRRDGVTPVVADMRDRDVVRRLAVEADAVIATASPGDETSAAADTDFAEAVLEGLRAGGTFVRTGGLWVHGSGDDITEDTPIDAPGLVAWRQELDERVLAAPGIRSLLVEPGIVYGRGGGVPNVVASAAQTGDPAALVLVGPGTQHWTTVHVDDLAELYVAVLEHGETGSRFLGVSGQNPTTRELGEAASRRRGLEGRVVPEEGATTIERLGAFGEALLLDQQATGEKTRRLLGWKPSRPSLVEEIAAGGYDPA